MTATGFWAAGGAEGLVTVNGMSVCGVGRGADCSRTTGFASAFAEGLTTVKGSSVGDVAVFWSTLPLGVGFTATGAFSGLVTEKGVSSGARGLVPAFTLALSVSGVFGGLVTENGISPGARGLVSAFTLVVAL